MCPFPTPSGALRRSWTEKWTYPGKRVFHEGEYEEVYAESGKIGGEKRVEKSFFLENRVCRTEAFFPAR
jgi:hypothetical protein